VQQCSRVLVAVDFSKPSRGAFEYALALSQRHGAELIVVQAVPRNQAFSWHARERLALTAKLRRRADLANVELRERVQQGDPAEIILLHARSLRPDVIVAGTHQRRGIDRFSSGSVAERVAAKATVPALLIPWHRHAARTAPFSHVAVAVDFSPASTRAVEQALAIASDAADRVTLLHVVTGSAPDVPLFLYRYGIAEYQQQLKRNAWRRLQLAVPTERQAPAAIHARVLLGETTTEISRAVDSIGADLLVVGVPKRGVVSRALFGITAARLLRVSHIPVLAVPEMGTASAQTESASLQSAA